MSNASLTIVGSGIKFMSHLTIEAKTYIEQSEKVFYLINEPVLKEWIQKSNPNSHSLENLYSKYNLRAQCYTAITNYIIDELRKNKHICVVIYGHPAVFAKPALDAAKQAKQEGFLTKILPGISAEDCLFADLLINPGTHGCISLEATDMLIHQKKIDTSCHLIIWQASIIGNLYHCESFDNSKGIKALLNYLNQYYQENHEIILYSAAQYPGMDPIIHRYLLKNLTSIKQSRTSLLYMPPINKKEYNKKILNDLDIQLSDLIKQNNENINP